MPGDAGRDRRTATTVTATESLRLPEQALDPLSRAVSARLRGQPVPVDAARSLAMSSGPVYATLRRTGNAVGSGWGEGASVVEALDDALAAAEREHGEQPDVPDVDMVELAITHSYRPVQLGQDSTSVLGGANRGILGLELQRGRSSVRYSPTWMLATNRSFDAVLELYAKEHDLAPEDLPGTVDARVFKAEQLLVNVGTSPSAVRMERGNVLIDVEEVTQDAVRRLADGMSDWLVGAVQGDGRLTYKYWPSRGGESKANNMIRQWMGTTALGRVARARNSPQLYALAQRNIDYNLAHFYRVENGLGLIVEDRTKVKLGAVALAARALVEHPNRRDYRDTELALRRMVDHLWQPDGRFRTWYLPAGAAGQENFYPGEALYLWSALLKEKRDPELLRRFMRSFEHYRAWHLDERNRNPAFIPWHTQAYFEVWQVHRDPRLADFVFEMNDWLLDVQQWEGTPHPDMRGRFYDPDRPHFGVPHASSTGVYLEGLADAYRLAVALRDVQRAEAYRTAIVRGLRSVMQLQFSDDVDLFYVAKRDRVRGGIRTTEYNNEIRVDNVQHNLMAVLKVLEAFPAEAYRS